MTESSEDPRLNASQEEAHEVEALIARNLPALRTYIRLRMGSLLSEKESASDLVQSTCRELLKAGPQFDQAGEPALRKWLFKAAIHKIQQRVRYYGSQRRTPAREAARRDDEPVPWEHDVAACYASVCTPSRVAMGREELRRVELAFDQLPEDYRDVILSARLLGLSHKEIAKDLGRSEGAVRVLLHRALARLAALLVPPE